MFVRVRSMSESFVGSGREFLTPVTLLSGAEAFKRASAVTNGAAHQRIEVAKLAVYLFRAIRLRSVFGSWELMSIVAVRIVWSRYYPLLLCWDMYEAFATA
eukprot:COSAG02_NODE_1923_length_10327_cov_6.211501_6_plen_101_part_00